MVLFQHTHNILPKLRKHPISERWSKFTVNMALARLHTLYLYPMHLLVYCFLRQFFFSFSSVFVSLSACVFFLFVQLLYFLLNFSLFFTWSRCVPIRCVCNNMYAYVKVCVCRNVYQNQGRRRRKMNVWVEKWEVGKEKRMRKKKKTKKAISRRKMNGKLVLLWTGRG